MFSNLGGNRLCHVFSTNIIAIRGKRVWARKALGSPVAKSKLFRVPQKPQLPEDESREIRRLFNNYNTDMKSLRYYWT